MRYKITTLTLTNRILIYNVSSYKKNGDSFEFVNEKDGMFKSFPCNRTSVEEMPE